MNKRDFVRCVCDTLRESGKRKPISIPKQVFHISDDDGNSKDFVVKKIDKSAIYTIDDVAAVVDACVYVIQDALKHGEPVTFHGLGSIGLHYRKPRKTKRIGSDDEVIIQGRYVPKLTFGNTLKMCAKIYELSLDDEMPIPDPVYDDDDIDDTDGD